MSVSLDFERSFRGARIPPWLQHFSGEPETAVEDLLLGRADLGHLGAADPVEILVGWVENLREVPGFTQMLDRALAAWIERSWGWPVLPKAAGSSALTARAWIRAADVIAAVTGLSGAAAVLRTRFLGDFGFLRALSEARSRDPEARAWFALARHQDNRVLISHWWRLCNLPLEAPWYHGVCGIHGLRNLPAADAHRAGTFPSEVAEGLARLAEALARRVDEGWLETQLGEEEFFRTAQLTMAAYPWPEHWLTFWRDTLTGRRICSQRAAKWVRRLFPDELSEKRLEGIEPSQHALLPDPSWPKDSPLIAARLVNPRLEDLEAAILILAAETCFADATGDATFLGQSARSLAGTLCKTRPDLALEWIELARRYEPTNAGTWTTSAAILAKQNRIPEALKRAIDAVQRFPEDAPARVRLGEILEASNALAAARIYAKTSHLLPRAAGDPIEAQSSQPGQDGGLDASGGYWLERSGAMQKGSEIAEPVAVYGEPPAAPAATEPQLRPEDLDILCQEAYFLRRWAGRWDPASQASRSLSPGELRARAGALLDRLVELGDFRAEAASEAGLIELDTAELDQAVELLRGATKRFPGSARVRYALARAERERALRDRPKLEATTAPARPWQQLLRLDEIFRPAALLGEGRTWLAYVDGSTVEQNARRAFGRLGFWMSTRPESDKVGSWWSSQANRLLFSGREIRREDDVPDLDSLIPRLVEHKHELDQLEEDWVRHTGRL